MKLTTVYLVSVLLCIIAIGKKNKKMFHFIIALGIFLLFTAPRESYDIKNYYISYSKENFDLLLDRGYALLCKLGVAAGLNFWQFRNFIVLIGLALLYTGIGYFTTKIQVVYLFYLLHWLFMDAIQLRNFLSYSIIIFGTQFLLIENKKNLFKYFICVMIAGSIHYASLFYLIFAFAIMKKKYRNTVIKYIFSMCVCMVPIFVFSGGASKLLFFLGEVLNYDKLITYANARARFGFLVPLSILIINIISIKILMSEKKEVQVSKKNVYLFSNKIVINRCKNTYFVKNILLINELLFVAILFCMANMQFYRLIRNIMLLNAAVVTDPLFDSTVKQKTKIMIIILLTLSLLIWCWFDFSLFATFDSVVRPVFEGEYFWK